LKFVAMLKPKNTSWLISLAFLLWYKFLKGSLIVWDFSLIFPFYTAHLLLPLCKIPYPILLISWDPICFCFFFFRAGIWTQDFTLSSALGRATPPVLLFVFLN
jgi:hypothetical protein